MLLWFQLVMRWQGTRPEYVAAQSISCSASCLSNWKDRSSLPPLTQIDRWCDAMGVDRGEGRAAIMLERRAKAQGLELALVISTADDGCSAELELLASSRRLVARIEPQVCGSPIAIRAGDVAATDGDIVCWTAVDQRQVIEAQRQRLAIERAQQLIVAPEQIAKGA